MAKTTPFSKRHHMLNKGDAICYYHCAIWRGIKSSVTVDINNIA